MAGWRAPAPAPGCTPAPGTPDKRYRDVLQAGAPGRNLRKSPFMNYTTPPGALMDPTRGSDDRGRGPDRDRGHAHQGDATPKTKSQSPCLTKEARFWLENTSNIARYST